MVDPSTLGAKTQDKLASLKYCYIAQFPFSSHGVTCCSEFTCGWPARMGLVMPTRVRHGAGGVQEAGEVTNGLRREGEGEEGRTGSCESCKNMGHANSSAYLACASSLGTLGMEEERGGSRSLKVQTYEGSCSYSNAFFPVPRGASGFFLSCGTGFPRFSIIKILYGACMLLVAFNDNLISC